MKTNKLDSFQTIPTIFIIPSIRITFNDIQKKIDKFKIFKWKKSNARCFFKLLETKGYSQLGLNLTFGIRL
jgi:hypothetical protein